MKSHELRLFELHPGTFHPAVQDRSTFVSPEYQKAALFSVVASDLTQSEVDLLVHPDLDVRGLQGHTRRYYREDIAELLGRSQRARRESAEVATAMADVMQALQKAG